MQDLHLCGKRHLVWDLKSSVECGPIVPLVWILFGKDIWCETWGQVWSHRTFDLDSFYPTATTHKKIWFEAESQKLFSLRILLANYEHLLFTHLIDLLAAYMKMNTHSIWFTRSSHFLFAAFGFWVTHCVLRNQAPAKHSKEDSQLMTQVVRGFVYFLSLVIYATWKLKRTMWSKMRL